MNDPVEIRQVRVSDLYDLASLPPNSLKEKPMTPDHNDPASAAVKPGWKSTEAWISILLAVVGAVLASGLLDPSDPTQAQILKVGGLILSIAAALGYQVTRASVKNTATEAAAAIAIERLRAEAAPAALELLKSAGVSDPKSPASQR